MKAIPPFVVVADRGNLRAYTLDNSNRTSVLRLIEEVDFQEGHERLSEKVTDRAGSFPAGSPARSNGNSAAERLSLVEELDSQNLRHVGKTITDLLQAHRPESWALAAPEGIFNALLQEVERPLRQNLACEVHRDLTNVPSNRLLRYFDRDEE
jgi:hypothetical protein